MIDVTPSCRKYLKANDYSVFSLLPLNLYTSMTIVKYFNLKKVSPNLHFEIERNMENNKLSLIFTFNRLLIHTLPSCQPI